MFSSFLFLFFTLYLAQMGDKTQILTLLLAARTKKHIILFFAVMAGFAIGVTIAVLLGAGLTKIIPHKTLELLSGFVFIIIGFLILKNGTRKTKSSIPLSGSFFSISMLIFLSDLGDKTQIAITLFSTHYLPVVVWLSAMAALGLDTILMIFFSKVILKYFKERLIKKLAGVAFVGIGIYIVLLNLHLI